MHNLGTGQLRIDVPLPPKPNARRPRAAPVAAAGRRPSRPRPAAEAAQPAGEAPAREPQEQAKAARRAK